MKYFPSNVVNFLKREDGPTSAEYALMLALIALNCILVIGALGGETQIGFSSVADVLNVSDGSGSTGSSSSSGGSSSGGSGSTGSSKHHKSS